MCGMAPQSSEAAVYGLANESARPTTLGLLTVAVLIPCEGGERERVSGEAEGRSTGHKSRRNTNNSSRAVARALGVRLVGVRIRQRPLDEI